MRPTAPIVLLDDAASKSAPLLCFAQPERLIRAFEASDIPNALAVIREALARGRHVAGWISYELGYALLPRLAPLQWPKRDLPLLWFGIFDAPTRIARSAFAPGARAYAGPLRHEWNETAYEARFHATRDYIAAGDIYQANLSFRSRFAFAGDPFALYLSLRDRAEAAHGAYIDMGKQQILSLSPELFFSISSGGAITARPMKGTVARGVDPQSDMRMKEGLAVSEKDRAENLMIVDLMRNDVGRVAEIGSVGVRDLFAVETYPTLHAMVSTVVGQLKSGTEPDDVIRALFPCGSVTGAPKIRAMEIIRELEQSPRGVYCGAIGHFAPDGSAQFNVAIRTILLDGNAGSLGIGGAVVQDSRADAEYAECLLKARYFESVRQPIGLIETLRWDGVFVRLGRHLDRMARSAAFLSLPFDRAAALATLDAAVAPSKSPQRVRLTLDEDGRFACATAPLGPAASEWTFAISPHRVDSRDVLLRHKTTWRRFYDEESERLTKEMGADETLFLNERGELTEGSRSTLFVRRDGTLLTPSLSCGLLDGILRRALMEDGRCAEAILTPPDLDDASEIWLGNSLRGLIRARPLAGG